MSLEPGTRLGGYVVEERLRESAAGERWTGSEPGVGRPVLLTITPLPADPAQREATRERLRRRAALEHPALLPVYGAGEVGDLAYVATRAPTGRTLADTGPQSPERAARIDADLRSALAALAGAGLAPTRIGPGDVIVEGDRAYLVPADTSGGHDAGLASGALDALEREICTSRGRTPRHLGRVGAAAAIALVAVAAIVILLREGDDAHPAAREAGTVVASVPLGVEMPGSLAAGDGFVWVTSERGLLRVDVATNQLIGSPSPVVGLTGPDALVYHRDDLYAADGKRIVAIDPRRLRVTRRLALPGAVGLAAADGSLFASVAGPDGSAELVEIEIERFRVIRRSPISGAGAVVEAGEDASWVVSDFPSTVDRLADGGTRRSILAGAQTLGGALAAGTFWAASPADGFVAAIAAGSGRVVEVVRLGGRPLFVAADDDAVWVTDVEDGLLHRIDPVSRRAVGEPVPLRGIAGARTLTPILVSEGAVWAVSGRSLVRVQPATAPAPRPPMTPPPGALSGGPVRDVGRRLVSPPDFVPPLSLMVPSDRWFHILPRQEDAVALRWSPEPSQDDVGVSIETPRRVFDGRGGLRSVRSVREYAAAIRANPTLNSRVVGRRSVGGVAAVQIEVRATPKPLPPYFCGAPCSTLYALDEATVVLLPGRVDRHTALVHGRRLIVIRRPAAGFGPELRSEAEQIIDSIRFEDE